MARKHAAREAAEQAAQHRCGPVCAMVRQGHSAIADADQAREAWAVHRDEVMARRLNDGRRHLSWWRWDDAAAGWRTDPERWHRPEDLTVAGNDPTLGPEAQGIKRWVAGGLAKLRFLAALPEADGGLTRQEVDRLLAGRSPAQARAVREGLALRPKVRTVPKEEE